MNSPQAIIKELGRRALTFCIFLYQCFEALLLKLWTLLDWHGRGLLQKTYPPPTSFQTLKRGERPKMEANGDEEGVSMSTIQDVLGSKRSIELQLLAFMLLFSASGLVPWLDLAFPIFVSLYIFLLARFVFPCYPMEASRMDVFHGSRFFHLYILVGAFLAFFLPFGFVLGSFSRGEPTAVRAATPHLFLSTAQMVSELVVSGHANISPPCRVILTLLYSSRRISALAHWMLDSLSHSPPHPQSGM
ncbi:hypothetical protein L7F22_022252 [Adiantum nelumboides]|nr:hypothetical protein [Adiantum nelumboides]